jgi:hypothetical protein
VIRQSISEASSTSVGWNGFRPEARRDLEIAPLA